MVGVEAGEEALVGEEEEAGDGLEVELSGVVLDLEAVGAGNLQKIK